MIFLRYILFLFFVFLFIPSFGANKDSIYVFSNDVVIFVSKGTETNIIAHVSVRKEDTPKKDTISFREKKIIKKRKKTLDNKAFKKEEKRIENVKPSRKLTKLDSDEEQDVLSYFILRRNFIKTINPKDKKNRVSLIGNTNCCLGEIYNITKPIKKLVFNDTTIIATKFVYLTFYRLPLR